MVLNCFVQQLTVSCRFADSWRVSTVVIEWNDKAERRTKCYTELGTRRAE